MVGTIGLLSHQLATIQASLRENVSDPVQAGKWGLNRKERQARTGDAVIQPAPISFIAYSRSKEAPSVMFPRIPNLPLVEATRNSRSTIAKFSFRACPLRG